MHTNVKGIGVNERIGDNLHQLVIKLTETIKNKRNVYPETVAHIIIGYSMSSVIPRHGALRKLR